MRNNQELAVQELPPPVALTRDDLQQVAAGCTIVVIVECPKTPVHIAGGIRVPT